MFPSFHDLMLTLFYPASFLQHKNHLLLKSPVFQNFLVSQDLKIYLTIFESDMSFPSSDVVLLGRIPYQTCMHYLEQSSALLFLSSFESLGLPLIEAAELAKPVICPDLPYARELLGDSPYYFLDQSAESLCNTLTRFIHCKDSHTFAMLTKSMRGIGYAWDQFTTPFNRV